jgi:hypothetical protein
MIITPSVLLKKGNVSEKFVEEIKHTFYNQRFFSNILAFMRQFGKM